MAPERIPAPQHATLRGTAVACADELIAARTEIIAMRAERDELRAALAAVREHLGVWRGFPQLPEDHANSERWIALAHAIKARVKAGPGRVCG